MTVDASGLTYHSNKYGITMIVPKGSVEKKATVSIGASLYSEKFKFEDNFVPVSPIVWVFINYQLIKPAELYIPHHIDVSIMADPDNQIYLLTADDESLLTDTMFTFKQTHEHKVTFEPNLVKVCAVHFCSQCCAVKKYEKILKQYLLIQAEKIESDNYTLVINFVCCIIRKYAER